MDYEEIVTLDVRPSNDVGCPEVLGYRETVLCYTSQGNWMYVGKGGPASRYIDLTGVGEEPHCFIVPASEVLTLLKAMDFHEEIVRFFPEALRVSTEA